MRVLLSGYYGFGNLGDEALLEVIVERMRARFPAVELEVLSATPGVTAARYGVATAPRWEWRAIRSAIARADVVLSGGGGLLQNATSLRSLLYYAGILREARRARRKTMIFAQSIGPLDVWGRFVVAAVLPGRRSRDRARRALARLLQRSLPDTPWSGRPIRSFLYDLPARGRRSF